MHISRIELDQIGSDRVEQQCFDYECVSVLQCYRVPRLLFYECELISSLLLLYYLSCLPIANNLMVLLNCSCALMFQAVT